jgi:hypothetical protein
MPIPGRRSGQTKPTTNPDQPLPSFKGTLKHMDDKTITLELGDNRVLDFRRTSRTKFFKGGNEVKPPKFEAGDPLSVEANEEPGGYLTAVNVYWGNDSPDTANTSAGSTTRSPEKDKAEGTPDAWGKDDPDRPVLRRNPASSDGKPDGDTKPAADSKPATDVKPAAETPAVSEPARPESTAEAAPATSRRDEDDPGRPVLRRGGPANQRAAAPAEPADPPRPVTVAGAKTPDSGYRTEDEANSIPVVRRGAGDDLIRRATDSALDFTAGLPAYVCQEVVTRFQSESRPASWQALDNVTMNLVYENNREDYRDIKVNGKPKNSLEETGGAWSTGEFGTLLIDLFSPATAADFMFRRESRVAGIAVKEYDFSVVRERSHWSIKMGSQSYNPAYDGTVWIDPRTARVMRIEIQAKSFPGSFPADTAESAVDYQYIRLGDANQYLLPVHAENLSCQRGTRYCSKNTIDFRNYHKYTGESSITFEKEKGK